MRLIGNSAFATMSLKFTAASLSRIRKPGATSKSPFSPLKKIKKGNAIKKPNKERLEALQQNVSMEFHMYDEHSVYEGVITILNNQWAELTRFHNRYYSQDAKESCEKTSDLMFLLRGISMEAKAEVLKYRAQQLPRGGVITVNQLYSFFDFRGNTFVDQSLEMCVRNGKLRKFVITNALPVILRAGIKSSASILSQKVTYGYENTDVVACTQDYVSKIEVDCNEFSKDPNLAESFEALQKFKKFVESDLSSHFVTNESFSESELKLLVEAGYLTLSSNHHNEIDVHQYSISFPGCGTFLKMLNSGRVWLVQTLSKAAFNEILEDVLFEKWEGKKLNNFRRPFYGYDLLWLLAEAKGAGVVEVFKTPVGKAWRLTGKL